MKRPDPSISARALACASPEVRRNNPHIFGPGAGAPPAPSAGLGQVCPKPGAAPDPKVKQQRGKTRTELEFEAMLRRENPGADILFERYTFKLANDCRYTPDFAVVWVCGRIDFYEVKGAFLFKGATASATRASLTKPKLAAQLFPWHHWFRAQKAKDGTWSLEEFTAAV